MYKFCDPQGQVCEYMKRDLQIKKSQVVLPGKDEFKIFKHYMYFSSDRAAAGL